MEIFAAQGFAEFILAAGYKSELVWKFAQSLPKDWQIEVVDTGEDTNTGGRVAACKDRLGEQFFVTYADGLRSVDLPRPGEFHPSHVGAATVRTVPLPVQSGTV